MRTHLCLLAILSLASPRLPAADLFDSSNLAAWCIVPFDKAKRGPEERAAMLEKLGFTKFVYDYRAEHVPTFDAELDALQRHHVQLLGWWFPSSLNDEAKLTLELFKRHGVKPQLWVTGGGDRPIKAEERSKRIADEVARLKPIAEAALAQGLQVGLYNHGGWFGEPETQLEIIEALAMPNVGMVYNLHHGHEHVRRLRQILAMIRPHLLCLNLNGMMEDGEKRGMKIIPLAQGEQDVEIMRIIAASGYTGPIGILNHTEEDAEARLLDNLDGLRWLVKAIRGTEAGERPVPRSWVRPAEPKSAAQSAPAGFPSINEAFGRALSGVFQAGEQPEFHQPPFTIECRAKLATKSSFNILVACSVKASADHWELYTDAGTGRLSFYQPGRGGDVKSATDVCDDQWHHLAAVGEETRLQLFVDGKPVAEAARKSQEGASRPGPLIIGGLVEKGLGCEGILDDVKLSKGVREVTANLSEPAKMDAQTMGLWNFDTLSTAVEVPQPTSFFYQFDPLRPELWPNRDEPVNRYRLYDFYTKQALAFRGHPEVTMTTGHPGVDGGLFGHWGYANEDEWRDGRWAKARRTPVQGGILNTPQATYPKAVVLQIGEQGERTTFFDPETLCFPMVAGGGFVGMSDTRHGMMDGVHFNSPVEMHLEQPKPTEPFRYHGYYRHGKRVVFSYERDGQKWLDSAWSNQDQWIRETQPREGGSLASLIGGGPAQWPGWVETHGVLGQAKPYTLDTIPFPIHPDGHPWFVSGHDFFADGTGALCTVTGDVWLVQGLDKTLDHVRWKRFASGLNQPLGLRIVDGKICVQGRDQITRLQDLNGDDEADFYECVTNAQTSSKGGHDFITGCEFDGSAFYFASGNQGLCRVTPGQPVEVLATGFRNPNGLGLARDGTVTTTLQEGEWAPASMICQIKRGEFYGAGGPPPGTEVSPPMCYLPRGVDNSCGGQCFTETDQWGPLGGQLIHFSSGAASHLLILRQKVGEVTQGAAVWLPGDFLSGAQQGRIHPRDGQLYVSGLNGWGCWSPQDGCFQRVRYVGGAAHLPVAFSLHENGILLRFSDPLGSCAREARQHFAQCWNYHYSAAYGSPELSVTHPDVEGHDVLEITSSNVLEEGRALFLEIPLLTPCHQVHVHVATVEDRYQDLYITAHQLAEPFTQFPGYQPKPKQFLSAMQAGLAVQALPNPWAGGPAGRELAISAAPGLKFAQLELKARAGERLSLTFTNPDVVPHNWVLINPGTLNAIGDATNKFIANPQAVARHYVPESPEVLAYTDMTNPGGQFTIHFDAPPRPGRYPYLCTFPGHWGVMNGVLIVE